MTDVIQLLPDSIANQIAAGEVVQRPASVVKELMENSVDADASKVTVIIKDGGKSLIQVIDDGSGMSATDTRMSLERHATSKIQTADDLTKVKTMGFRGEALASMAAVSQIEIKTKLEDNEVGTSLKVEGSNVKSQDSTACSKGTSISVKNLFFNVPARRNFLKSNGVETKHIIEEFQRVALSRPDMDFSLYQNDLESYKLSKGKLSKRIVNLFGKNYREQLVSVDEHTDHLKVTGYVGKPESARKTRGEQYIFVNQRFIRSGYLNHAVMNAYQGLIAKDYFPFYVLFIEIDSAHIDVNVHPTKTEIKFVDERTVYGVIRAAIRQALGAHNISPSIDFEADINFGKERSVISNAEKDYSRFRISQPGKENIEKWEQLYSQILQPRDDNSGQNEEEITFPSTANIDGDTPDNEAWLRLKTQPSSTFLLHGRYILTQVKSGMMIMDISRAHERILYEKFMSQIYSQVSSSQQSLFPQTLNLNPSDYALLQDIQGEIKSLGFDFDDFGNNSIVIHGFPSELSGINEKLLFEGLLEQYKINKSELSLDKNENLSRSLAKRSAIKTGETLNHEQMNSIIDNLFACKTPNFSPEGQLIFFILDLSKIEDFLS